MALMVIMLIRRAPEPLVGNFEAAGNIILNPAGCSLGIEIDDGLDRLGRKAHLLGDLGHGDLVPGEQHFAPALEDLPPVFFGRIGNCLVMSHLSVFFCLLRHRKVTLKPIKLPIQIFVKGKMGSLNLAYIRAG